MNKLDVTVIDYGVGNLLSVQRGFEHCGAKVTVTSNPDKILSAKRVVLPGVGAFSSGMNALDVLELGPIIHEVAKRGTSLMGICLGMQLLLDHSEEFGMSKGLGLIPGNVKAIPDATIDGEHLKIPHIGWNEIIPHNQTDWSRTLLSDCQPNAAMYFVHSFMAIPNDETHRVADCIYGGHQISAVISRDNILGTQFHPEKSGGQGLKVLRQFLAL